MALLVKPLLMQWCTEQGGFGGGGAGGGSQTALNCCYQASVLYIEVPILLLTLRDIVHGDIVHENIVVHGDIVRENIVQGIFE